jgi:hypothetical protein
LPGKKPKVTRAEKAGRDLGHSIVELANLMYQNNTAKNFYKGLMDVLFAEVWRRSNAPEHIRKQGGEASVPEV